MQEVKVAGDGLIDHAQVGYVKTPIINLPLLRWISFTERTVDMFSGGKFVGGTTLFPQESPEGIAQDGQYFYMVSSSRGSAHGDHAIEYHMVRAGLADGTRTNIHPRLIEAVRFSTFPAENVIDNVFDGNSNSPTLAINLPKSAGGRYSPLVIANLALAETRRLPGGLDDLRIYTENGRNFLDLEMSPQTAGSVVLEGTQGRDFNGRLEAVFDLDADPRSTAYRVKMDSRGMIYQAEKVTPRSYSN